MALNNKLSNINQSIQLSQLNGSNYFPVCIEFVVILQSFSLHVLVSLDFNSFLWSHSNAWLGGGLSALTTILLSCSNGLRLVSGDQSLVKGLVDIEVLPLFGRGLAGALETTSLALGRQRFEGDKLVFIDDISHITLCQDEHDGLWWLNFLDLVAPLVDIIEAWLLVAGNADHEAISSLVLNLSVHTKVFITGCIVDLDAELLLVHILDALVDVQDRRLIVLREGVMQVIRDKAWLTDCCIAAENQLDLFGATTATTSGCTSTSLGSSSSTGSRGTSLRRFFFRVIVTHMNNRRL